MATVMNACLGSWKCGKSRTFPKFPQPLLLFFEHKFPEKITVLRGEGNINDPHPREKVLFKQLHSLHLTLPKREMGGFK